MQRKSLLAVVGMMMTLLMGGCSFAQNSRQGQNKQQYPGSDTGFAVLELFTSEGCSSCPPADELMGRFQEAYGNKPVYILAYHVDYWNRLGWKDVFSSPAFSERQQAYSQKLRTLVYTPQLVFNGEKDFNGSDGVAIQSAINSALNTASASVKLDLTANTLAGNINVTYQVSGNKKNDRILIALVQKQAVSQIERGENAGRTIAHWQIVRKQSTITLHSKKNGQASFPLPEGYKASDWEIIGLIQNTGTGKIMGANKARIQ